MMVRSSRSVVLGEPLARDRARVRAAEHGHRARVGGERLPQQQHEPRPRAPATPGAARARGRASSACDEPVAGEQRERRVDRQQPAAEEARLHAQVEEQRDREDQQDRQPHTVPPSEQHRPAGRGGRGDVAEPPQQAVEVVERAGVLLLAELVLAAGQLGLPAQLVQRGVEVEEEVRVGDEERREGAGARARARRSRPPAARPRRAAASSGSASASAGREQHEPGRVLEADREAGGDARPEAGAPGGARLVHPGREQQHERDRRERPDVGHGQAREGDRQEREAEHGRGDEAGAAVPQLPPGGVHGGRRRRGTARAASPREISNTHSAFVR